MLEIIGVSVIGLAVIGLGVIFLYFQITGMKEFDE